MATAATDAADAASIPHHIRRIGLADLFSSLADGWSDFLARPSHLVFLFIVYPVVGAVLSFVAFDYNLMPLVFPLIAGFALVGPVAAVGVMELSRRRETGETPPLAAMASVLTGPSGRPIAAVAGLLLLLFLAWLVAAQQIVFATIGRETPAGLGDFARQVTATPEGWTMFLVGNGTGFLFAVAALCISVMSLPLLVDGERSARVAVQTSLAAVLANPFAFAVWGLIIAIVLAIAMAPAFVGLLIALPWLGHATWRLYRRTIEPAT